MGLTYKSHKCFTGKTSVSKSFTDLSDGGKNYDSYRY